MEPVHFGFLRQGLSLAWNLLNKQGCIDSETKYASVLGSSNDVRCRRQDHLTISDFSIGAGGKTGFPALQQAFYQLSYLPSSGSV